MISDLYTLDHKLLIFFNHTISNDFFNWFFPAITDLHKLSWFKNIFIFPLLGLWIYKDGRKGLFYVFSFIISLSLTDLIGGQILKKFFERPRPFVEYAEIIQRSPASGYSFISNHAANSFAIAFFLSSLFPSLRIPSFTFAILVGFSRIYNGVHYVSDVLLGALVGTLVSFLVLKYSNRYYREKI